ncbi:phosphoribosylglycinamide formyltransferase [Halobacteriales archaeon QS_1_68_20]|nr:MAG: phosphoribosylglycinamide formyltransferase [Halobacteriales archaeon QS_1_68_20]
MKIAGLTSDRGRALVEMAESEPGGATLAVVVTDEPDAPVLRKAEALGVPTEVVVPGEDETWTEHERRVLAVLDDHGVDLVCMDGDDRTPTAEFVDAAPPVLDVHPSLLPAFPGPGAWREALEAGVSVSGSTVHVVTGEEGTLPIVTQEPVPVYGDEDDLRRRLGDAGVRAYARAVRWFAEGRVTVDRAAGTVTVDGDDGGDLPERYLATADRVRELRYGENPHQDAAVYADEVDGPAAVVGATQRNEGAKALSYNNYNDADAALNLVREFEDPAAAVIKHTNPAGCAVADSIGEAYDDALATDPKSAFGGVVALNRPCDTITADSITDSFKEVVVAPGYTDDALAVLREKDDLRVLDVDDLAGPAGGVAEKHLVGGRLVQQRDRQRLTREDLEVVTERDPTDEQVEAMLFAWQVVKHVKSNAIAFAAGTETVGIGAGQVSRVDAVELAAKKADRDAEGKSADGAVMASDAFFPFPDGVEAAAEAGVEAVVQPGGSVNDDDVIEACDDLGLAMAFTGKRAFRHD